MIFVFVLITIVGGCTSTGAPGSNRMQMAIEHANPACSMEPESRFALGGLKMSIVKALVRLSGESDSAEYLPYIRRVEIETIRMLDPANCAETSWMDVLGAEMTSRGWWPMVVERDGLDSIWAFAHSDPEGDIDGLVVIDVGAGELEVVRVAGRMDRVLAMALAEDPETVGRADR